MPMPPSLARPVVELLRLPGRTLPIPGWFPLVVEAVHPAVRPTGSRARIRVDGMIMDLDLDEYVQRRIYYRAHEIPDARWVRRMLRPGDQMLDIGANVGFFTLIGAAAVGPSGHVIALEPVPGNADILEANVRLNGLSTVTVHREAAGDHSGEISLGLDHPDDPESGASGHYTEGGGRDALRVPVRTVDEVLAGMPRRLRLVKVDVEGAEPRVLAGMSATLEEDPPDAFILEVNPSALDRQGFAVADLLGPLQRSGYQLRGVTLRGHTGRQWRMRAHRPQSPAPPGTGRVGLVIRGLRGADPLETVVALRPGVSAP